MITRDDFVAELEAAVPESVDLVDEHLAQYKGVVLDLLMGDLLRLTVGKFSGGKTGGADRVLAFVDRCLREGDEDVVNAVGRPDAPRLVAEIRRMLAARR